MTGFVGADTEALRRLASLLKAKGAWLDATCGELNAAVQHRTWLGPDADAFGDDWQARLDPLLRQAGDAVRIAGRDALRNAIEQDQVSDQFDSSSYGGLLKGASWSDIINWAQDVWPVKGQTVDDIGGYATNVDFGSIAVGPSPGQSARDIYGDVNNMAQGNVGDCWLMSALASVGSQDPDFLDRHITANPDSTWTVRLYDHGKPVDVVVGPGDLLANGAKQANGSPGWMSVYEAAALKHNGGELYKITADTPAAGLELVTGKPAQQWTLSTPSLHEMRQALSEGRPITAMSDPILPLRSDVAAAHVYTVTAVDPEAGTITVTNPWGPGDWEGKPLGDTITIPISQWNFNFTMLSEGRTK